MKYCFGIIVIALLAAGVVAASPADQRPILRADFDRTSTPVAAQAVRVQIQGSPRFIEGLSGQAVVVGGKSRILYTPPGGLSTEQGSCLFWAKPLDWSASVQTFQFLVSFVHVKGDAPDLLFYKPYNDTALHLLAHSGDKGDFRSITKPVVGWLPGQWRQWAFTWSKDGYRLYMNGKLIAHQPPLKNRSGAWGPIVLGTAYPGWAKLGDQKTAIDDLRIYAQALPPAEIARQYQAAVQANPEIAVKQQHVDLGQGLDSTNWALAANGAAVLTSSFANIQSAYSDHLIDGDPDTSWRSMGNDFPSVGADDTPLWIQLRWLDSRQLSLVTLTQVAPSNAQGIRLQRWDRAGQWVDIAGVKQATQDGGIITFRFPEISTSRLRVLIAKNSAPFTQMTAIGAYGPPQPDLRTMRPYWHAWHIWYNEPAQKIVEYSPRYFRKTFNVADAKKIDRAVIQLYTNDNYQVFLNGQLVSKGIRSLGAVEVKDHVVSGENCLAIIATATSQPHWPNMALAAELTLDQGLQTRYIGTDQTWQAFDRLVAGWDKPGFKASGWSAPFIIAKVGQGIWGHIGYEDAGAKETLTLHSCRIDGRAKPGGEITVYLELQPGQPLHHDYLFTYEMGEHGVVPGFGDYTFARGAVGPTTPTHSWPTDRPTALELKIPLPAYAPNGPTPLQLLAYDLRGGPALRIVDSSGQTLDHIAQVDIHRFDSADSHPAGRADAHIAHDGGVKAFVIQGKKVPPLLWTYRNPTFEKIDLASKTGIHLYAVRSAPLKPDGTSQMDHRAFSMIDQEIQAILRIDPDARFIVSLDLRPSTTWLDEHPEARLKTAFGDLGPQSYFAHEHLDMLCDYCRHIITSLQSRSYYARIFGYHILACGLPDSVLGGVGGNLFEADRSKITIGDDNPQAIAAFQQWLRKKYDGSVSRLRASWHDEVVTFDTARPRIKLLTRPGDDGGIFIDPAEAKMAPDYFQFLSGAILRFHEDIGRCIKSVAGNVLVGSYYGYELASLCGYNMPGSTVQNSNLDWDEAFKTDALDYYAMVPDYSLRLEGTHLERMSAFDSFRLSHKQMLTELDLRTFTAEPVTYGRQRTARESVDMVKRDLGMAITDGTAAWFADWDIASLRGVGFYVAPKILDVIRRSEQIYRQTLADPRDGGSQIAVVVGLDDWFHQDIYRAPPLYNNLIARMLWRELPHVGASYDVYHLKDIDAVAADPRYKLILFLGGSAMTDAQIQSLEKLKSNGRTLLWFYAPGYVNPAGGLSAGRIARVAGISVQATPADGKVMSYRLVESASIRQFGLTPGDETTLTPYGNAVSNKLYPLAFSPVFQVTDAQVRPLGRYPDGGVALAEKKEDGWRSIYCAVPFMKTNMLRAIAREAGVHIDSPQGAVIRRDGPFLLVQAGAVTGSVLRLNFRRPRTVHDLYADKIIGREKTSLELSLKDCSTFLLRLDP